MGQALYRNYRPRRFTDVVGQDPITKTLQEAIKSGRISHAYLMTGPRGVGKTSVARILAHQVNDLAYKDERVHLDIIEIDAASNRRIDEIRDIREKVHIAPTSAKYKVYIIDEVHMLTKEAFNALLKTLEEPPAHCIFILATTEVHKLPETIISRTQRFNFKPVTEEAAVKHLKSIAKAEKIDIKPAALQLLAEHGQGSFRDSISLLDQLSGTNRTVTEKDVREMLGLPAESSMNALVADINCGDVKAALHRLSELRLQGTNPVLIASQLAQKLRNDILNGQHHSWVTIFLKNLLEVSSAKQPYALLEISVLEAAQQNSANQDVKPHSKVQKAKFKDKAATRQDAVAASTSFSLKLWPDVLSEVKKRAPALYTALRLAEPTLDGNTLTLGFQFPLHMKKVNESRHINLIAETIESIVNDKVIVRCTILEKPARPKAYDVPSKKNSAQSTDELATISNIFGSAEVLES